MSRVARVLILSVSLTVLVGLVVPAASPSPALGAGSVTTEEASDLFGSPPQVNGLAEVREPPIGESSDLELMAASPAPSLSFLGSPGVDGKIVPDTQGAVGPRHVMSVTNGSVIVHDKSDGAVLESKSLDEFWEDLGFGVDESFDPRVIYDTVGSRWLLIAADWRDHADSVVYLAFSKDDEPFGWDTVELDADLAGATWADFPNIGFNNRWVVVTARMFFHDHTYDKNKIWVLPRNDLYDPNVPPIVIPRDGIGNSALVPAITHDAGVNEMYFMQKRDGDFAGKGSAAVYTITGTPHAPVLNPEQIIQTTRTWASGDMGNFAPQKGTSQKIHTGDDRIRNVVLRNNTLYASQTIHLPALNPDRAAVQVWSYDIGTGDAEVCSVDDPTGTVMRAWPSVAVNANNDMLIGYTRFSADGYPTAAYSSTDSFDGIQCPWGTDEVILKAGEASFVRLDLYGKNRWGDYSATVVDPTNDLDMWTIQEYAASPANTWGTWWGLVKFTPPDNDKMLRWRFMEPNDTSIQPTNYATMEAGERDKCDDPDAPVRPTVFGATVWYRITGKSVPITVDTFGSDFDTVLVAYRGNETTPLTYIGCDDDVDRTTTKSRFALPADPGADFVIQVGGFDGGFGAETGRLVLNYNAEGSDPPWWPDDTRIWATEVSGNSISVAWTPAEDDVGVMAYAVYLDRQLVTTTTNRSFTFTGLQPGTRYHLSVLAGDGDDQWTIGSGPAMYATTTAQGSDRFIDDNDSIFEADIEWMAAVGITKGCNPPTNDRFCPDANVTRGQMAAFLVRALGYTDNGGGDLFVDDDDSIFEADIDRLGTAGVTKGCNPPTNDRFCPTGNVTRGQMAAFLHRALG